MEPTSSSLIGRSPAWERPRAGKAEEVRDAMRYTFQKYRENAWGADDIRPVTGGNYSSRNAWGAFIVDSASTLAIMELWEELKLSVDFITKIDFSSAKDLVDPFETTIRYLGGLVSMVELSDVGFIPEHVLSREAREQDTGTGRHTRRCPCPCLRHAHGHALAASGLQR